MRFCRTGVQYMEEYSLPFACLNWVAMPEHAVIDRRIIIKSVHGRIPAASPIRVPVVQGEEDLVIVRTWCLFRINVETSELTGIPAPLQITPSKCVRVVPAETRRPRRKAVTPLPAWHNHGRALFHRAIFVRRNPQSMPVHNLGHVRMVHNIDRDWLALRKANQRAGKDKVVRNRVNYFLWRNLQLEGRHFKPHIRWRLGPQLCLCRGTQQRETCSDKKITTIHLHAGLIECS